MCKKDESIYRIKTKSKDELKDKTTFYKQLTKVKSITLKDMFTFHDFHQVLKGE